MVGTHADHRTNRRKEPPMTSRALPAETRRVERGHAFYPPTADLAVIPPLYATEHVPAVDKIISAHYFVSGCASDWWIVELDPDNGLAFGYARLAGDDQNAEWGYVSLPELETLYQDGGFTRQDNPAHPWRLLPRILAERDLHWVACTAAEADLPGVRARSH